MDKLVHKIMLLLILVLNVLLSGCVNQGDHITEEENIQLNDISSIEIDSSSADIELVQENREDISVTLKTYEYGPKLKIKEGDTLYIDVLNKKGAFMSFNISNSPKLIVKIPNDYKSDISIDNSSGDLNLRKLNAGNLEIDLKSGDIDGHKIHVADCSIDSSSGDIKLDDFTCDSIDIDSSSGDLELDGFIGELNGHSSSGDVRITYKEFGNDITYETSSGDIILDLNDPKMSADFKLDCNSGDVDLNFTLDEYAKQKDNEISGQIGTGEYRVDLHASSGDIVVRK